ncbi:NADP-dependent oxidoreductase [Microbacterium sp. W1N]|uniref:NADP-dependent oxidoreductase n=1 Tax=Microbacterium festucae TaxID=2977531 RepID=UPI0021BF623E|nr:NADP-dependent oxidoreductase [Microbacterium festucae]MCT9819861.1 NADP-dependent oxidoreductase [Microbacterium festucae]
MRAFVIDAYKKPLHEAAVSETAVGDDDVLIAVAAAGVNGLDERIRTGAFAAFLRYRFPLTLGHDVAGTVLSVGAQVTSFAPGDVVYARPRDHRIGTFAERIAVDQADVAFAPTSVGVAEAASLPLVALTAWQALVERGKVTAGQKVLIHGGAGGVGSIAIQLARHLGAHVATTVSGADVDFVRELGADIALDYRTQDFAAELSDYDLVLDSVGAENLERSIQVLRRGGTAIGISGPPTPAFARQIGLNPALRLIFGALSRTVRARAKKRGVTYEFLFMRPDGAQLRTIADLVDAGALRPVVGATFPFDQAPEALAAARTRSVRGKTVLLGA